LLVSDTLAKLFEYTQEMMNVKMEWGGEEVKLIKSNLTFIIRLI